MSCTDEPAGGDAGRRSTRRRGPGRNAPRGRRAQRHGRRSRSSGSRFVRAAAGRGPRSGPGVRRDLEHLLEETADAGVTRFVWLRQNVSRRRPCLRSAARRRDGRDPHVAPNSTLALDGRDLDHPFNRLLVDTAVSPDADAVAWITPSPAAARGAAGDDRHPRQDRGRRHPRP